MVVVTQNIAEHNCVASHAQNTSALQPDVFLTGTLLLGDTNKMYSAFPSTKHSQGQLQTHQSVAVVVQTEYSSLELIITYIECL
jgi:hypothetical protein